MLKYIFAFFSVGISEALTNRFDKLKEALIKLVVGRFGLARGARRQRKAWGERGFACGTPGSVEDQVPAREVGDSPFITSDLRRLLYRTLRAL